MSLFNYGEYVLHSGSKTDFFIDCDALTDEDWDALAQMTITRFGPFSEVEGVPEGGLKFADACKRYLTKEGGLLIVDDVLTTGASIHEQRGDREAQGVVVFTRTMRKPDWVTSLFLPGRGFYKGVQKDDETNSSKDS